MIVLLSAYLLRVLGHVGLIIHDDDLTLGLSQNPPISRFGALIVTVGVLRHLLLCERTNTQVLNFRVAKC